MKKIELDILTEVSYTLLTLDKQKIRRTNLSHLYRIHRRRNKHEPSNSWGGYIQDTDTAIGDDIERIRHIRNKLNHSAAFKIKNWEFKNLCKHIRPLLRRFNDLIRPQNLYTVRLDEILKTKFWWSQ